RARSMVDEVRSHDRRLDALGGRLDEVGFVLTDLASEMASYAQSVDVDPHRLAELQDRRAALVSLTRKYGPGLADVLAWAEDASVRASELAGEGERIDELTAELEELGGELLGLAARLTEVRRSAGTRLAHAVCAELQALAMPHATIEIAVGQPNEPDLAQLTPLGHDQAEILLAANPGAPARPLGKGASGGELSRVMLALEVVLAGRASVPTFVFDEVDAGIGGRAAVEVGRRLARLARHAQVVAVTHLPQVAAFADRHYRVVKSDDGTVTTSGVQLLDRDGRVAELSRMLAGLEGSQSAEQHAGELL